MRLRDRATLESSEPKRGSELSQQVQPRIYGDSQQSYLHGRDHHAHRLCADHDRCEVRGVSDYECGLNDPYREAFCVCDQALRDGRAVSGGV